MPGNRKRREDPDEIRKAEKEVGKNIPAAAIGEGDGDV